MHACNRSITANADVHGASDGEAASGITATVLFIFGLNHATGLKIRHLVSATDVPLFAGLFRCAVFHSGYATCVQEGDFCKVEMSV